MSPGVPRHPGRRLHFPAALAALRGHVTEETDKQGTDPGKAHLSKLGCPSLLPGTSPLVLQQPRRPRRAPWGESYTRARAAGRQVPGPWIAVELQPIPAQGSLVWIFIFFFLINRLYVFEQF